MQSFLSESRKLAFQYNETLREQIQQICAPIFENFGIKNLNYSRRFSDGHSILFLSTNMECSKYVFSQVDENGTLFKNAVKNVPNEGFYYFLWPITRRKEDHVLSAFYDLNMWHGLTIYRREGNFLETWDFASDKGNEQITDFFINRKDILERFIFYFKERSSSLINLSNKKYLILLKENHNHEMMEVFVSRQKIDRFLEQTPLQKHPIRGKTGQIYLSKRESECLFQLSLGKTAKETARLLDLRPRTIEFYLKNIKEKTGFHKNVELVKLFAENKFMMS